MIIGRSNERGILLDLLNKDESQLCVVYGRRRVGKTYLVRETFNYLFTFQHTGISGGDYREQLKAFRDSLRISGMKNAKLPHNWFEAFQQLGNLIEESSSPKKVVFIDEFPWMDTPKSNIVSAFEHFWNGWVTARKEKDVIIILCGSATSWITKKLLQNKGGLRGRITRKIKLSPFSLGECEKFSDSMGLAFQRKDILDLYMIMGGIPYYWSFLNKGMSVVQNVDELFFSETGPLHDEFDALYSTLFRNPEHYLTIIQTLATKKSGMSRKELIEKTHLEDNGKLTSIISDLAQCEFIREYPAIGKKERGVIYQLIDNYTLFYYRCVKSNSFNDVHYWRNTCLSPEHNTWKGLAFERVCLLHIGQIKFKLGISGVASNVCSWERKGTSMQEGAQIDLLIVRKDKVINICEMKYSDDPFAITKKYSEELSNKIAAFCDEARIKDAIMLTMVTTYGVARNKYWNIVQSEITMDDLFIIL